MSELGFYYLDEIRSDKEVARGCHCVAHGLEDHVRVLPEDIASCLAMGFGDIMDAMGFGDIMDAMGFGDIMDYKSTTNLPNTSLQQLC